MQEINVETIHQKILLRDAQAAALAERAKEWENPHTLNLNFTRTLSRDWTKLPNEDWTGRPTVRYPKKINGETNEEAATRQILKLYQTLNNAWYGKAAKRHDKLFQISEIKMEHSASSGFHIHGAFNLPLHINEPMLYIQKYWTHGKCNVKPIYGNGWYDYMAKLRTCYNKYNYMDNFISIA